MNNNFYFILFGVHGPTEKSKFNVAALNAISCKLCYEKLITSRLEALSHSPDIESCCKECINMEKQRPQRFLWCSRWLYIQRKWDDCCRERSTLLEKRLKKHKSGKKVATKKKNSKNWRFWDSPHFSD